MGEAQHLGETLASLFAYNDHGLFTPFTIATDALSADQAAAVPAPRFNSIWAVVNHVRFWQQVTLHQLRGEEINRDQLEAEKGWPAIPEQRDQAAWTRARQDAIKANQELTNLVLGITDEAIGEPISGGRVARWQLVQGIIGHNSYHTCEIISIRHMLELWLDRT